MTFTIPLCIIKKQDENKKSIYKVHPIFSEEPIVENQDLSRALQNIGRELKRELEKMGKEENHEDLIPWTFDGNVNIFIKEIEINLKRNYHKIKVPLVTYKVENSNYAFPYNYPELTFEISSKDSIEERASEVLEYFFKKEIRDYGDEADKPGDFHHDGSIWIHRVELELSFHQNKKESKKDLISLFSDEEEMDGEIELAKVGRCVDSFYPELTKVAKRQDEINLIEKELSSSNKRPLLLIGKSMVGKTAIIENVVYNRIEKREKKQSSIENIWHIAPQRLISGMSYVGQWENRVLAIIKEVKKRKLVLYFDDLIGLFKAGKTSDSSLNVAMVLKPYIEKKEIRILGEMTNEAFQRLKELDRGFAELFYIIPIKENDEKDNWDILLSVMQHLEYKERCQFSIEVVPTLLNILRRFMPHLAFPGKVIQFMNTLAVKYKRKSISRESALKTFKEKTGLSLYLLDNQIQFTENMVEGFLSKKVIGQKQAIKKMSEAVSISKAKLNDPDKPQYTFVFLGPTGVGKTECAKALAEFLFSSEKKLLRFDMNEFSTPYAVEQLCGTLYKPDGLLTSAVMQNPFSVILFDEIEKAHPEVYNLLLQVLGEARLTDALGRVINFSGAFIILTSNLGVKENWSSTGFINDSSQENLRYLKSVQNFFSPEFYNRLDQIIPFNSLKKGDIKIITSHIIDKVFNREGLKRRQSFLNIEESVIEVCANEGYHPLLGARYLKRVIEDRIVQPISKKLAAFPLDTPVIINLSLNKNELIIDINEINFVENESVNQAFIAKDLKESITLLEDEVNKIDEKLINLAPNGAISIDEVGKKQYIYFQCRDSIQHIQYELNKLKERVERKEIRKHTNFLGWEQQRIYYSLSVKDFDLKQMIKSRKLKEFFLNHDIEFQLLGTESKDKFRRVAHEAGWIGELSQLKNEALIETSSMIIKPMSDVYKSSEINVLLDMYQNFFKEELGYDITIKDLEKGKSITISSPGHYLMLKREEGIHIILDDTLAMNIYQVFIEKNDNEGIKEKKDYSLIRIYNKNDHSYDVRSGYLIEGLPNPKTLKTIKMAGFGSVI